MPLLRKVFKKGIKNNRKNWWRTSQTNPRRDLSIGISNFFTAGQPIGSIRTTGQTTGIHLHFEVAGGGTP
ncbi:hypothetical protein C7Y45_13610 [Brevibacillus brevis]|nr:hypothetical protein C7Y45_13610 [Lysinibacillus sp. SDF0063]